MEVEGDEVTIKNWDDLPPGMTRALQELSVDASGKIKLKTHGKLQALTLLLRIIRNWAPELAPKADVHNYLHLNEPHDTDALIKRRLLERRAIANKTVEPDNGH